MEAARLVEAMAKVSDSLRYPIDVDESLQMITASTVDAIPPIDHASISVTAKNGRIQTLAPTDQIAVRADELQYEVGQGPCLRAALDEPIVQVDDLAGDVRWPVFGPKAAESLQLGSQIAFQFRADPHVRGALNLYADQPHSIDMETRQLGAMFANLAAVALGWSRQKDNLSKALDSRGLVGQAIGVVMERYRLDPDRAFAFLLRVSQSENIKLRDVAAGIVADAARQTQT